MRAVRFSRTGGPEVLELVEVETPKPGPGQALIRQTAIGVNFVDTYHRSGLYPLTLPSGLGAEGAGAVEAVGPGVTDIKPGDRVGYCAGSLGSYADFHIVPAANLIPLPDQISDELAAAMLLKGLTAWVLFKEVRVLKPGETILWYAAAGGVGLIGSQWAKKLGATVIGVTSTPAKAELAKAHGCDHVILSNEDIAARVREITGGKGVPVVYDSVGKDTWLASLDSLSPRGLYVSYGSASGPPPPISMTDLMRRGSLYATRPTSVSYLTDAAIIRRAAADLFDAVLNLGVKVEVSQRFPLAQVADAHRALESRATTGSTILIP
jgi:NADPH2:quinone reductase